MWINAWLCFRNEFRAHAGSNTMPHAYPFMHACMLRSIHPCRHILTHPWTHAFILLFIHLSIHPPTCLPIHPSSVLGWGHVVAPHRIARWEVQKVHFWCRNLKSDGSQSRGRSPQRDIISTVSTLGLLIPPPSPRWAHTPPGFHYQQCSPKLQVFIWNWNLFPLSSSISNWTTDLV